MNAVAETKSFQRAVKRFSKKYPRIQLDMDEFIVSVTVTHKLPQSACLKTTKRKAEIWKYRQDNRDLNKGKSSGYRVIAAILNPYEDEKDIRLMTVYVKNEKEDLTEAELNAIVDEVDALIE